MDNRCLRESPFTIAPSRIRRLNLYQIGPFGELQLREKIAHPRKGFSPCEGTLASVFNESAKGATYTSLGRKQRRSRRCSPRLRTKEGIQALIAQPIPGLSGLLQRCEKSPTLVNHRRCRIATPAGIAAPFYVCVGYRQRPVEHPLSSYCRSSW